MKVKPYKLTAPDGRRISLTVDKVYEVLGIEGDYYRILSDKKTLPYGNDPLLYEADCFIVLDPSEPDFWISKFGKEGERYCYPPEWSQVGFFEDYHDGKEDTRRIFWNDLKRYYPETWHEQKES